MGRTYKAEDLEGYEFSHQMTSNMFETGSKPFACDYFLRVIGGEVPIHLRDNPIYPGREEVQKIVFELFTPDQEILLVHRMIRPVMRLSLSDLVCDSIVQSREYYARFVGKPEDAVKWRVWAPIGVTVQAYFWKTRWVSELER